MQKYRFSNPPSVVEVSENTELGLMNVPGKKHYKCLCRGFGQNNHAPRAIYRIMSATPSQAARYAIEKYRNDCDEYGTDQE